MLASSPRQIHPMPLENTETCTVQVRSHQAWQCSADISATKLLRGTSLDRRNASRLGSLLTSLAVDRSIGRSIKIILLNHRCLAFKPNTPPPPPPPPPSSSRIACVFRPERTAAPCCPTTLLRSAKRRPCAHTCARSCCASAVLAVSSSPSH